MVYTLTLWIFTVTEIVVLSIVLVWVFVNMKFLEEMIGQKSTKFAEMFSVRQIRLSESLFFIRLFMSFVLLAKMEYFPSHTYMVYGHDIVLNMSLIIVAILWIPEIIALVQWAIFFSVFGLAGLGAAIFLDIVLYDLIGFNIWFGGKLGVVGLLMVILIVASFRYFANYSIGEIMRIAEKVSIQRIIVLISGISYMMIGGGILWRWIIASNIYRQKISPILDKIETTTAAISVIIIIGILPAQILSVPIWLMILIFVNMPIAFTAIIILIKEHKFGAWKQVFEIYTEEFAGQSLTISRKIKDKKWLKIALVGNWAAIPIALYDVGTALLWIINDIFIVIVCLVVLGAKYISSMLEATREILKRATTASPNTHTE